MKKNSRAHDDFLRSVIDTRMRGNSSPKIPNYAALLRRGGPQIKSLVTNESCTAAPEIKQYTGTKMLGIATMHKSNSVPIFSQEEAIDVATMRRN